MTTKWGLGCLGTNSDDCDEMLWIKKYRVVTGSFSGASKYLTPSQFNIYTDGSKIRDGIGCGAVTYSGGKMIKELSARLPGYASVFFAELEAIILIK